jgi:hypothetical protein
MYPLPKAHRSMKKSNPVSTTQYGRSGSRNGDTAVDPNVFSTTSSTGTGSGSSSSSGSGSEATSTALKARNAPFPDPTQAFASVSVCRDRSYPGAHVFPLIALRVAPFDVNIETLILVRLGQLAGNVLSTIAVMGNAHEGGGTTVADDVVHGRTGLPTGAVGRLRSSSSQGEAQEYRSGAYVSIALNPLGLASFKGEGLITALVQKALAATEPRRANLFPARSPRVYLERLELSELRFNFSFAPLSGASVGTKDDPLTLGTSLPMALLSAVLRYLILLSLFFTFLGFSFPFYYILFYWLCSVLQPLSSILLFYLRVNSPTNPSALRRALWAKSTTVLSASNRWFWNTFTPPRPGSPAHSEPGTPSRPYCSCGWFSALRPPWATLCNC